MRLQKYLQQIEEDAAASGGAGVGVSGVGSGSGNSAPSGFGEFGGGTTTSRIAQYHKRMNLGITKREAQKNWKKKKKEEEEDHIPA
jgi:hypothetical protein